MPLTTRNVPFKNRSIFGVVRNIAKQTKSKNVTEDGFVSITASSTDYTYKPPSHIFMDTDNTYWRTIDDSDMWFIIDFGIFRVDVEGYTIYTGDGDYRSEWNISASEDGRNWSIIGQESVTKLDNVWCKSFRTNKTRLRYFKMKAGGVAVSNYSYFAIYRFDVFGKLYVPETLNYISLNTRIALFSLPCYLYTFIMIK